MTTEPTKTPSDQSSEELMAQMRKRFSAAISADKHNRTSAEEDLEFAYVPGCQWPADRKAKYEEEGRPAFEINRMPAFLGQVIGDQRQAKPSIKIHPVDSKGDPKTAEIREGLIRNIESVSNADIAYDTAFEHTTGGGFGFWRVCTDYCDDNSFDQEIKIKAITNSFSVAIDPVSVEWDLTDAEYVIVHSVISRAEYERTWPGKTPVDVSSDDETYIEWFTDETVRIAEYFYKKPIKKKIYLLETDEVVDKLEKGHKAKKERMVDSYEIMRQKVDGYNILEEEQLWPSKYYPIVPVWGKTIYIDGKKYVWGVIRYAKDSQRAYNVTRSRETEMYMLAPLAPIMASAKMVGPYASIYQNAHKKSLPWLPFQADPDFPGQKPERMPPPQMSTALAQSATRDVDDMKATMGLFDASLGNRSNETSGVAIQARQKEGDVGTFPFIDNLGRARLLTYKIILDLIPKIYDTRRVVQILGIDGTVTPTTLNDVGQVENEAGIAVEQVINDMTAGKYDVTLTMGPSYSTQRMEAADSLTRFIQAAPETAVLLGDLIAKNQDWPGAQEVARRLKTIVPPQALTPEEREEMAKDAPQPDPNAPPPAPDPRMIEMQMKMQIEAERLKMEMDLHEYTKAKMVAEIENIRATGVKSIAQAEALEVGQQLEQYKLELTALSQNISHLVALKQAELKGAQGMQGGPGGNGQGEPGESMPSPEKGPGMAPESTPTPSMAGVNPEAMAQPNPMEPRGIEGRAGGGPVNPNQPYLVGEKGPEVIVPNQAGFVVPNDEATRLSEILSQNSNLNFVQRIMKPDTNTVLMDYAGPGTHGTHLMSSGEYDGKGIAYPEIIQGEDGNLKRLDRQEAIRHAIKTGEYISFDTPEEAEWFGTNYKKIWGNK